MVSSMPSRPASNGTERRGTPASRAPRRRGQTLRLGNLLERLRPRPREWRLRSPWRVVRLALHSLLCLGLRAVVRRCSQGHLQRQLLMPPEATHAPLAAASSRAACTLHGAPARVTDKKNWVSTLVLPTLGPKRLWWLWWLWLWLWLRLCVVVVVVVVVGFRHRLTSTQCVCPHHATMQRQSLGPGPVPVH